MWEEKIIKILPIPVTMWQGISTSEESKGRKEQKKTRIDVLKNHNLFLKNHEKVLVVECA